MRTFLRDERGFTLLDMLVACAVLATMAFALATVFGMRPARAHAAAVALESALVEARSLAASTSDATDLLHPTGATVIVEAEPNVPGTTRIAVFRSRPVVFNGQTPYPPVRDNGFPALRVAGTFTFYGASTDGAKTVPEPFAILLSGSGYASIVTLPAPAGPGTPAYDEASPATYATDSGCSAATARIAVAVGPSAEDHPFACTGGTYAAN